MINYYNHEIENNYSQRIVNLNSDIYNSENQNSHLIFVARVFETLLKHSQNETSRPLPKHERATYSAFKARRLVDRLSNTIARHSYSENSRVTEFFFHLKEFNDSFEWSNVFNEEVQKLLNNQSEEFYNKVFVHFIEKDSFTNALDWMRQRSVRHYTDLLEGQEEADRANLSQFLHLASHTFTLKVICELQHSDTRVFSSFPKELFDYVTTDNNLTIVNQNLSPTSENSDVNSNIPGGYYGSEMDLCFRKKRFPKQPIDDSPPSKTFPLLNYSNSSDFKSIHSDDLSKYFNLDQEIKGFHLPDYSSSKVKDPTPTFRSFKKTFLLKRKGIFIPYLEKTLIMNSSFDFEDAYTFKLLNVDNKNIPLPASLIRFKNPLNSFSTFYKLLTSYKGSFFYNPSAYEETLSNSFKTVFPYKIKEQCAPSTLEYMENLYRSIDSIIEKKELNSSVVYSPLHQQQFSLVGIKVQEDKALKKKTMKAKAFYEKLLTDTNSIKDHYRNIYQRKADFTRYLLISRYFESKSKPSVDPTRLLKFACHLSDLKNQENEFLEIALKNGNFQKNTFVTNLYNDGIKIISLSYVDVNTGSSTFTVTSNSETKSIQDFFISNDYQSNKFKIEEVFFLIDKPVLIYVDSKINPKAVKVGGPYYVKVSKNKLSIALKDYNSFFGLNDTDTFWIHPHASSKRFCSLVDFTSGCLGEAQALIYKAFENNSLEEIILSAMIWVTSANSSDPWGRNYVNFINSSDVILEENLDDNSLTSQEDVSSFLSTDISSIEQSEESHPQEPPSVDLEAEITPQEPTAPVQQTQTVNTQYNSSMFNQPQESYSRYT